MVLARGLASLPCSVRLPPRGLLSLGRQRKEPKKADPDCSARCAGPRACAGRADGHPWPAARKRDLGPCILHGPDRPARNIVLRAFGSSGCLTPRAHTSCLSRAVPPLPKGDEDQEPRPVHARAVAVAVAVAVDFASVGQRRAAQSDARERRACSSPGMGEFAPGAAHALRARARMARAGLGREAGCESGQGARRAAQGTPRSGAQAVARTALVTFPKRKVTRAAAAARNRGILPSPMQEPSFTRHAGARPEPAPKRDPSRCAE